MALLHLFAWLEKATLSRFSKLLNSLEENFPNLDWVNFDSIVALVYLLYRNTLKNFLRFAKKKCRIIFPIPNFQFCANIFIQTALFLKPEAIRKKTFKPLLKLLMKMNIKFEHSFRRLSLFTIQQHLCFWNVRLNSNYYTKRKLFGKVSFEFLDCL